MRRSRILCVAGVLVLAAANVHARVSHGYSDIFSLDTVTAVDDQNSPPQATAITSIYPNPFNPRTTIAFASAEGGPIDLAIYDLRGRLVRALDAQARAAGRYEANWDGLDDAGHVVPTGTYFCRLATAQGVQTMKLTLAR